VPHFVILGNWTDQGIRNVKDAPKREADARKWVEQHGGKLWTWYTFGAFDFMSVLEAPNDETALEFVLNIGRMGNARTTTLKAWSAEDATKVMGRLT
jgi:uncharacterized protein with GYD domain